MTDTYLGNKNLKRSAIKIEWTKELVLEYKKCSEDQVYFIKKYCKIVNVDRGLVNFELWTFQQEMVTKFENNRFTICKMPRQVGKTTTVAAFMLHKVLFNENYSVAILANKDRQAREILSRIQLMFEHLPKWLQQGVVEWNKGNIELENGSKVLASATSSSAVRGGTFNLLYLDEFAFVPNNIQEEFFSSVYPTISSGTTTKVIITSTPNGMNLFYKIWVDSENNKNHYARVSVHWSMIPGRDEKWMKETIDNTSERQFRQEYGCEFLGSSNTLIDSAKLLTIPYIDPISTEGGVDRIEEVKKDRIYLISVDTSRGSGIDYSAFVVFDITEIPYKVVAKYRDNEIESLVYPTIIYNVAKHYNNAYVLVEINDVGQQVVDILLHDLEYDNILSTRVKGRSGQKVSGQTGLRVGLGVRTTPQVKRIGCANFKSLVENDKIIINDYDIFYEMCRFIEHNKTYQAEEGEHDDLVMCCVLFSWLVHQDYFREISDSDVRLAVLDNNKRMIEENLVPFGFIDEAWVDPDTNVENDQSEKIFNDWFRS
jgi:Terminase large subunit, T4likevirus-type, N-terminal/Terminase RNaseH-like domain